MWLSVPLGWGGGKDDWVRVTLLHDTFFVFASVWKGPMCWATNNPLDQNVADDGVPQILGRQQGWLRAGGHPSVTPPPSPPNVHVRIKY